MSVTFWCPDAPTEERFFDESDPTTAYDAPVAPWLEINMANSNASAMMRAIGLTGNSEYHGEWSGEYLQDIRRRLMKLANSDEKADQATESDFHGGNFHVFGRDRDYVKRRAQELLTLVTLAIQHNSKVLYG